MNRWQSIRQLFLARMREFYREPMVLVWVYVFPLFLALGLGVAFSGALPESLEVDVQQTPDQAETARCASSYRLAG